MKDNTYSKLNFKYNEKIQFEKDKEGYAKEIMKGDDLLAKHFILMNYYDQKEKFLQNIKHNIEVAEEIYADAVNTEYEEEIEI